MLDIKKIVTIDLDDFEDWEELSNILDFTSYSFNKWSIDDTDFDYYEGLDEFILGKTDLDMSELMQAFKDNRLDYINFEHWN